MDLPPAHAPSRAANGERFLAGASGTFGASGASGASGGSLRDSVGAGSLEADAMAPLCAVFRRYLKSRKLKYTPERADILNAIIEHDQVFEAEELLFDLRRRDQRISKATIYRTIRLLQDAGIITQALFDQKQTHYRLIYGREPRNYMVCLKTGRHIEFSSPELVELRNRLCRAHGWEAAGHRFQIYAISPDGAARDE